MKRYSLSNGGPFGSCLYESQEGAWVRYEDAAKLESELKHFREAQRAAMPLWNTMRTVNRSGGMVALDVAQVRAVLRALRMRETSR